MLSVALSKLYKVDYAQIIDNAAGSHIAKENIYDKSKISGNLVWQILLLLMVVQALSL